MIVSNSVSKGNATNAVDKSGGENIWWNVLLETRAVNGIVIHAYILMNISAIISLASSNERGLSNGI